MYAWKHASPLSRRVNISAIGLIDFALWLWRECDVVRVWNSLTKTEMRAVLNLWVHVRAETIKAWTLQSRCFMFPSPRTLPASALGDSMDQLSQRSSSERTQFMSREDLDQEGSLDLDHEQYHDQDQDQYTDQELEQHDLQDQDLVQKHRGANISTPTKTLELKVRWGEATLFEHTETCRQCRFSCFAW